MDSFNHLGGGRERLLLPNFYQKWGDDKTEEGKQKEGEV